MKSSKRIDMEFGMEVDKKLELKEAAKNYRHKRILNGREDYLVGQAFLAGYEHASATEVKALKTTIKSLRKVLQNPSDVAQNAFYKKMLHEADQLVSVLQKKTKIYEEALDHIKSRDLACSPCVGRDYGDPNEHLRGLAETARKKAARVRPAKKAAR